MSTGRRPHRWDEGRLATHPVLRGSACFLAGLAAAALRRAVAEELADEGLSWADMLVLAVVAAVPGIPQGGLPARTGLGRTTVSQVLPALEEDGLLEVAIDPGDRRRHRLQVTPAGAEAAQRAGRAVQRGEAAALALLTAEGRQDLHGLLESVVPAWRGAL